VLTSENAVSDDRQAFKKIYVNDTFCHGFCPKTRAKKVSLQSFIALG
jgi:hypothetical protein